MTTRSKSMFSCACEVVTETRRTYSRTRPLHKYTHTRFYTNMCTTALVNTLTHAHTCTRTHIMIQRHTYMEIKSLIKYAHAHPPTGICGQCTEIQLCVSNKRKKWEISQLYSHTWVRLSAVMRYISLGLIVACTVRCMHAYTWGTHTCARLSVDVRCAVNTRNRRRGGNSVVYSTWGSHVYIHATDPLHTPGEIQYILRELHSHHPTRLTSAV